MEIKNAKIVRTMLGYEDHGILTCYLQLDYGVGVQSFGGYAFDQYDKQKKDRVGGAYGTEFVGRLLKTIGIEKWEDLPGKHIRVEADRDKVFRIGHILEDRWFDPKNILLK